MEIEHYGVVAAYIFSWCYFVIILTNSARVFFIVIDLNTLQFSLLFEKSSVPNNIDTWCLLGVDFCKPKYQ